MTTTSYIESFKRRFADFDWKESYGSLVLAAIVVIVLGLLLANYFNRGPGQIGGGEQTVAPTPTETKLAQRTYRVAQGESLSSIAEKTYGSVDLWPALAVANKIANPDVIFVGTELKLPAKAQAEQIKTQATATSYQVVSGDTLFTIAEKVYGNGSRWMELDRANNIGRLGNGNPLIFAGSTLVIPR